MQGSWQAKYAVVKLLFWVSIYTFTGKWQKHGNNSSFGPKNGQLQKKPISTEGWNWMGTPREQFFARNLCILLRFFGPTQSLCLKYVSIVYRWRLQLQGPRGPVPVRVSSHGLLFQCLLFKFFNNSLIYYLHISLSFVKSPYTIAYYGAITFRK